MQGCQLDPGRGIELARTAQQLPRQGSVSSADNRASGEEENLHREVVDPPQQEVDAYRRRLDVGGRAGDNPRRGLPERRIPISPSVRVSDQRIEGDAHRRVFVCRAEPRPRAMGKFHLEESGARTQPKLKAARSEGMIVRAHT
jgi:hypothetical protein